jgi:aspartyl-tRNA(Asn)/glutamyl-tRNA(Gln) amidotransferase subunit C
MTKITKGEVEKIAKLARVEVSENEKTKYAREMTEILGYVEKLNKVKTENILETSQVTGLESVYREDIASESTQVDKDKDKNREKLLKNAPSHKDGYIRVKQVLE